MENSQMVFIDLTATKQRINYRDNAVFTKGITEQKEGKKQRYNFDVKIQLQHGDRCVSFVSNFCISFFRRMHTRIDVACVGLIGGRWWGKRSGDPIRFDPSRYD